MKAEAYLKHWVLPNFYFHITTAYAILRHNGVELGKADYLAGAKACSLAVTSRPLLRVRPTGRARRRHRPSGRR